MNRYSIKMRASNKEEGHISGAEKLVPEEELEQYCARLLSRALRHSKGKPDFINLKIEAVREEEILHLPALEVTTIATSTPEEGMAVVLDYLRRLGLEQAGEEFCMLVMPDHPTPISLRTHTGDEVPYLLYQSSCVQDNKWRYNEREAAQSGHRVAKGCEMIDYLIGKNS